VVWGGRLRAPLDNAVQQKLIRFNGFTLDVARGRLLHRQREVKLRPKSFELLRHLAENAGRLILKQDLIDAVWPNVFVTEDSLTRCISEVRSALSDSHHRIIKTVQRRGYVFEVPVSRAIEPPVDAGASSTPRFFIAVLPFANLNEDPEHDFLVGGITESLITDLSRIRGALVTARSTAFGLKAHAVDAREIWRKLRIRYLVQGSIMIGADRVRVHAQLADAAAGSQIWADRFDNRRHDCFETIDEITARLSRAVAIALVAAESQRAERERPHNMDAADLAMCGWAILNQPPSLERARAARRAFETALKIDSSHVDSLIGLAHTHLYEVNNYTSANPVEQLRLAEHAVTTALSLASENARAHFACASLHYASHAPERALRECELAISLDFSLAIAHAYAGAMKVFLGRARETESHVLEAMRLSPRDPARGTWHLYIGAADLFLGRLDRAVQSLRRSVEINPNYELSYFYLAAALALQGCTGEAFKARDKGLRLSPNFTIGKFRSDRRSDNETYLRQRESIIRGLRKAQVPEA
jgi:TolB-like protein/tetratricopeptide (TPR) repeat protein